MMYNTNKCEFENPEAWEDGVLLCLNTLITTSVRESRIADIKRSY